MAKQVTVTQWARSCSYTVPHLPLIPPSGPDGRSNRLRSRFVKIHCGLPPREAQCGLRGGLASRALTHVSSPTRETDEQLVASRMSFAQFPLIEHDPQSVYEIPPVVVSQNRQAHFR